MINYVLYILIFQLLFLITYDLFHKKDTFFSLNRLYLLVTSALSFVLPFIKIKSIPENIPDAYVINLPTFVIGQQPTQELTPIIDVATKATQTLSESSTYFSFETLNWWLILYCIGTGFMFIRFIKKIFSLWKLRKKSSFTYISGYKTYTIPNSKDAFSFYNAIYVGDQLAPKEKEQIIIHEIVHLREKHTLDLLWFEFLKIIFWFNPFVYVYQSRIDTIHEFIADAKSVDALGKRKYYEQLLHTTFETENIDFINQFFNQSLLKKRIAMLQKQKSTVLSKYKYLTIIPILGIMLVASSFSRNSSIAKVIPQKKQTNISTSSYTINDLKLQTETNDMIIEKEKKINQKEMYYKSSIDTIIPFSEIEKSPTTKACQHIKDQKKQKECISKEIKSFIHAYFDMQAITPYAETGPNRIYTRFKIDKKGNITDIETRGSAIELEIEAKRVIDLLPQMIPGEHKGEKVTVLYSLPILLNIDKKKPKTVIKSIENDSVVLSDQLSNIKENNVQLGYYLITGIFKRKSYLTRSQNQLKKMGLDLKYFKNPKDEYYYAYLERFDQLEEAKKMLSSDINGTYQRDLYILKIL